MTIPVNQPLPTAPKEYEQQADAKMRRQVEQNFQNANAQIMDAIERTSGESSRALLRFQFLLMGAPNG